MRYLFPLLTLLFLSASFAQSVWLEGGVGYDENEQTGDYEFLFKGGVRGTFPISEFPLNSSGLYASAALRGGLLLDAGGWFTFLPEASELYGFESHLGTGLTYAAGSFGVALSAGVSYDITQGTCALSRLHPPPASFYLNSSKPLTSSAGLRIDLDEDLLGPR